MSDKKDFIDIITSMAKMKPDQIERTVHQFENGYSASVVRGPGTYGWEQGLYELAVLKNGIVTYDTPITDDVKGCLSEEEVQETLEKIKELK